MSTAERVTLQRIVDRDRRHLREAIARVEAAARRQLDAGRRAAEHRWAWLGAGFCLGLMFGFRSHQGGPS